MGMVLFCVCCQVLDGITLRNLEVFKNSNGGTEGTLMDRLDRCSTRFGKRCIYSPFVCAFTHCVWRSTSHSSSSSIVLIGKLDEDRVFQSCCVYERQNTYSLFYRLLRRWLCAPLCRLGSINARLQAVTDLRNNPDTLHEASELLKTLPDLERILAKWVLALCIYSFTHMYFFHSHTHTYPYILSLTHTHTFLLLWLPSKKFDLFIIHTYNAGFLISFWLVFRVHTQGLKRQSSHPDTRAIFFEDVKYNRRKVIDFLAALGGFQTTLDILKAFKGRELGIGVAFMVSRN